MYLQIILLVSCLYNSRYWSLSTTLKFDTACKSILFVRKIKMASLPTHPSGKMNDGIVKWKATSCLLAGFPLDKLGAHHQSLAASNTHVIQILHSCALCIAMHHNHGYWAQLLSNHNWTIYNWQVVCSLITDPLAKTQVGTMIPCQFWWRLLEEMMITDCPPGQWSVIRSNGFLNCLI